MSIIYDDKRHTFTLHTETSTYQMQVDTYGFLLHLYYGKRADGNMEYLLTYYDRGFSGNPYDVGGDRTYSMDALPQEFPCLGSGDFRTPAFVVTQENGITNCDLRYTGHKMQKGKYGLKGLPAVYAGEEAETLEILLEDRTAGVTVKLLYGVIPNMDIITRSTVVENVGTGKIHIEKVGSACLDFVTGEFDFISFYGRHAMERNFQRVPVTHGNQTIGSRRGTSSHQYNPMMILADRETTEDHGSCYALSFVYSGGFKGEVEQDQFDQTRVVLGLQEEQISYPLDQGAVFYAPEVILTYSGKGLNKLSQNLHACIRKHICRGKYKDAVRPVLVNSWEAAYFDFTGDTICELAKQAAEVGIELLVMDDGWFGKRDNDNRGLGDWQVNEKKLGGSLESLIKRVNEAGVKFGIWIEPEMVNEDSELYRAHPDWVLQIPGKHPIRSRNQLVLDFSRKEIVDYIYDQITQVLKQGNIEYIKWDMNRSLSDIYSTTAKDTQGSVLYDYMLGLYEFLERLVTDYPNILIEGCSGGGGRFDAGMLYYTPQIWCSDNTDAIDRVRIQYGTSFGYPTSTVGAHVSAVPNHQTGRITPMQTRAITAMAGTFGYELDLGKLTQEEKQQIRTQIKEYHQYENLIQKGVYYRLTNPYENKIGAWLFTSYDKKEVLVNAVMLENHGNMPAQYIRLKGLEEGALYKEAESGIVYSGGALMEIGIPLPVGEGEYQGYQIYLRSC